MADPETIDKTWMLATGAPVGPFRILDIVGLVTAYNIVVMNPQASDPETTPGKIAATLKKYIDEGKTGELVGTTIQEQTAQVKKNIAALLEAAGSDFDHVVKTTCFLDDMDDFVPFNEEYAKSFGDMRPARSAVAVEKLPKGALVEVEVIAEVCA